MLLVVAVAPCELRLVVLLCREISPGRFPHMSPVPVFLIVGM